MGNISNSDKICVTVISPFYNEAKIVRESVEALLAKIQKLPTSWELILVNDGSTDGSESAIREICDFQDNVHLISYKNNRGRGYALRKGIESAKGDIIITTEIDLSWGDDIVERLYHAMMTFEDADIVVASPHLNGGGYKNVPWKRTFFSKFGNKIIRTLMTNAATMNTGMTRAYRKNAIQCLPLEEDHKEFHLEVILKAKAFNYRIYEIPCILEWKEYKHQGRKVKRKSSSKIKKLVYSHTLFSLFGNPIRYVWGLSAIAFLLSTVFLGWGVVLFFLRIESLAQLVISLTMAIISLIFFTFGVIAKQGNMIQRELWILRQELIKLKVE